MGTRSQGAQKAGGSKSNAPIPQLEENITEVQWTAWKNRFERWQASCKITDKAVENRIFESIPNTLADQICVSLSGEEDKEALLAKRNDAVVKKRSVFLYRKDLHQIVQGRAENPERYAARIRQAAPPCCLTTDNKTPDYSADLMSSIFILGLEDSYTREKLFQIRPSEGDSTVRFDVLVKAASEIQQAKDNCLEAGKSSVCGVSGSGDTPKKSCMFCNTSNHQLTAEGRKFCKARDSECGKCKKKGHFTNCCNTEKWAKKKVKKSGQGKVNVVNTTDNVGSDTQAAAAAAPPSSEGAGAPVAALNSVQQVRRDSLFSQESCDFWSVTSNSPAKIQTKRLV